MAEAVILIGFMGSGKTAVGMRLAEKLGWDFIDADEEVVRSMGMSIPEAFTREGEDFFRRAEEETVLGLLDSASSAARGTVIALGGGSVTIKPVRERLKQEPCVVLLDEDVDTAFERASGGSRPLAQEKSGFRSLFEERSYLYRQAAGFTVDTRKKSVEMVAEEIEKMVSGRSGRK